ncbi:MAG: prefoldin subunit alpha [Candidatus Lokiarchaeota archaeon]
MSNTQDTQNINKLYSQFQNLRAQKEIFENQLGALGALLRDLYDTKKTIENLKKLNPGEEILIPIGDGRINLKGTIKENKKVLVAVSEDVIIEKNTEDSIEFIDKLIQQQEQYIKFLREQIQKIELNLQSISQVFQQNMPQS